MSIVVERASLIWTRHDGAVRRPSSPLPPWAWTNALKGNCVSKHAEVADSVDTTARHSCHQEDGRAMDVVSECAEARAAVIMDGGNRLDCFEICG